MAMRTDDILLRAWHGSADRDRERACRHRAETRQSRRRSRMHPVSLRFVDSLAAIESSAWDRLVGNRPLLSHAFLHALHDSGCAAPETGWTPNYITAWRGDELVGAMPLYLKSHSYGEYVFDWSWADAYRRHGLAYYPKLLNAVPFTPVPGPRLLAHDDVSRRVLLRAIRQFAIEAQLSSAHVLFLDEADQRA